MSVFVILILTGAVFAEKGADKKDWKSEKSFVRETVAAKADQITGINRYVWQCAELGYHELKSSKKLTDVLEKEGFKIDRGIANIPTAFAARYGSGKPVLGILAEFDALPKLGQQAGVAVKTPTPGNSNGHGCAHSVLGAGAVGGALAVKEYLKKHPGSGTVILFGCPAEETGFGKAFMTKAGCFKELDAVFSWHPGTDNSAWAGRTNAYLSVRFSFFGISAHAAGSPDRGRSALDACELMNVGVNYLREHLRSHVRIHYAYLDAGGEAPNVVQDHTELLFFVRAPKIPECREVLNRVVHCAQGAAIMTETKMEYKILGGLSGYIPTPTVAEVLSNALKEAGGPEYDKADYELARKFLAVLPKNQQEQIVKNGAKRHKISEKEFADRPLNTAVTLYDRKAQESFGFASTDDGDVSQVIPAARMTMTSMIPETSGHTWFLTAQAGTSIGDKSALAAARVFAFACLQFYYQPELLKKAKEEHEKLTDGPYDSPIPDGVSPGEK